MTSLLVALGVSLCLTVRLVAQEDPEQDLADQGPTRAADGMRHYHRGEHARAVRAFEDVYRAALATDDEGGLLRRVACVEGLARFEQMRSRPEGVHRELRPARRGDDGYEVWADPLRDPLVRIHGFCPLVERARTLSAGGHDLTAAILLARELELGDPRVRALYDTLWRGDRAFAERVVRAEPWSAATVDELRRDVTALVRGTRLGAMAECDAPVALDPSDAGPRALIRCVAPVFDDPTALYPVHDGEAPAWVSVIVHDAAPYAVEGLLTCVDPDDDGDSNGPSRDDPRLRAWERGARSPCRLAPPAPTVGTRSSPMQSFDRYFVDDPSGSRVIRAAPDTHAEGVGELPHGTEVLVTHFEALRWDRPGWARIELPIAGWLYAPARSPPWRRGGR